MALPSFDSDAELVLFDAAVERLEPKGKAKVLEIIIVSDAVEGKAFWRNRRKSTRESGSGQKELIGLKREKKKRD